MCLPSIIGEATACMKKVLACLCCILCAGPIMAIIGIVILASPNDRAERVSEYNNAVTSFNASGPAEWVTNGGNIANQPTTVVTSRVTVSGNTEDVSPSGQSVYAQASQDFSTSATAQSFRLNRVRQFTRTLTKTSSKTALITCPSSGSTCSVSTMASTCSSRYGGTYTGPTCSAGTSCGPCTYSSYLSAYCAVAQRVTGGNWEEDTGVQSCMYPFTAADQKYVSTQPSSIAVQLYDSQDPFIALERLTKGSGSFGITAGQQHATGVILLVIGLVLIACIVAIIVIIVKCVIAKMGNNNGEQNNAQQQQPAPQPAPAYGQPAPAYGQPAPAYGQPAPTYGQPAPTYGQPAPTYGQPAPTYGQPAPTYGQPAPTYGQPAPAGYGQPAPAYGY